MVVGVGVVVGTDEVRMSCNLDGKLKLEGVVAWRN